MIRSSRRQFIASAGAAAVLAACGSKSSSKSTSASTAGSSSSSGSSVATASSKGFGVAGRLPQEPLLVPGESRLAVSLIDTSQTLMAKGPALLEGAIVDSANKVVVEVSAKQHATGIAVAYWPFRFTIAQPGFYTLRLKDDDGHGMAFGVYDPAKVEMPYLGAKLPAFDTPTVDDHRGVEPYCSLTPNPCPLHAVTLTAALQAGKPVVYMVGTPAHCQTGACAPALEFLVAAHQRVGDAVSMVHADVFADNAGTVYAPAVDALALTYEPVAYFCRADGTIVDRLDAVWDQSELDERLAALTE